MLDPVSKPKTKSSWAASFLSTRVFNRGSKQAPSAVPAVTLEAFSPSMSGSQPVHIQSMGSEPGPEERDKGTSSDGSSGVSPMNAGIMLEVLEDIMNGRQPNLSDVKRLHKALLRGDITIKSSHLEEELLSQEELEEDVGLNLMQLLGSQRLAPNRGGAASSSLLQLSAGPPGGLMDSAASNCTTSSSDDNLTSGACLSVEIQQEASCSGQDSPRWSSAENVMIMNTVAGQAGAAGSGSDAAASSVPYSLQQQVDSVLATVDDWQFDAFRLHDATAGHPLSTLSFYLLQRSGLVEKYQMDAVRLARFLRRIEDGYPDNPYHNRTHAADVLQSMHVMLTRGGLIRRLGEDLAMLAGYLAAVVHDYQHRGLNNDYLVRVTDDLALTYNDISPMENHHVSSACRMMTQREYGFLRKLPQDKKIRLRKLLIDCVLATDMKQHFSILSKFQGRLQVKVRSQRSMTGADDQRRSLDTPLITEDDNDRSLVLQVCLKCADVGHLSAPWEVHHRWVARLEEEFFRQGDKEKDMTMAVSPLMDRTKDGITKSQVGFFDIVALPLFHSWASVFTEALPLAQAVEDNCNRWRALEVHKPHSTPRVTSQ